MKRYEKEALRVAYEAVNKIPNMTSGGTSLDVAALTRTLRYLRGCHGQLLILIDALRYGPQSEVERRTADLQKALAEKEQP